MKAQKGKAGVIVTLVCLGLQNHLEQDHPEQPPIDEHLPSGKGMIGLLGHTGPQSEEEKLESFVGLARKLSQDFYESAPLYNIATANDLEDLEAFFPAARKKTLGFLEGQVEILGLAGLDLETLRNNGPLDDDLLGEFPWLGERQLPEHLEELIQTSADIMLGTAVNLVSNLAEMAEGEPPQEFMSASLRAHTDFYICLGISHEDLPEPKEAVLQELVRQFSFSSRVFQQEVQRLLWKSTKEGEEEKQALKRLLTGDADSEEEDSSEAPGKKREPIEARNEELCDRFSTMRKRANATLNS